MAQRILLHACCGPCAIAPVLALRQAGFAVTALFVNPNIHPLCEYLRRREAMKECARKLELPVIWRDDLWDLAGWLRSVAGLPDQRSKHDQDSQHDKSGQGEKNEARCAFCYTTRLSVTARMAAEGKFDCFSSSLLYSRHQRHETIAKIATAHAQSCNVAFHYTDFREDWQKGIDISKEWGVYRQPYCGCVYSEAERYSRKLKKLLQNT